MRGVGYAKFFKRCFELIISFIAIIVLSPVLLLLIIAGSIAMRGTPFFVQSRPGKKGRMVRKRYSGLSNSAQWVTEKTGDDIRLHKYGRILRSIALMSSPSCSIFL